MEIGFKQCNSANYSRGRTKPIEYLVLHYTANDGDTDMNNAVYFAREVTHASAHYFVDEDSVTQSVLDTDTAWHCGGGLQGSAGHQWHGICTNSNSIGIEMCSDVVAGHMSLTLPTVDRALELTKWLMAKYNIPAENVIRHHDVTGKDCPAPWVTNEKLWTDFKEQLTEKNEVDMVKYESIEQVPVWYREAVEICIARGAIKGDGNGLDVSEELAKTLTVLHRLGVL